MWKTSRIAEISAWADERHRRGKRVGLVPTLGYLHEGHLSHVKALLSSVDEVVLSVFVNPLQFGPGEDFSRYPRDLARDARLAEQAGVAALFAPDVDEMYPTPAETTVEVTSLSAILEGAIRPTHLQGVATVVTKLFNIVRPDVASFGQKDLQQLLVVRRLVQDLNLPVSIVAVPTVREPDGLAMSSRNSYLDPDERTVAGRLYQALQEGLAALRRGQRDPFLVERAMADVLTDVPGLSPQYVTVRSLPTLTAPEVAEGRLALLIAARLAHARLLDNVAVEVRDDDVEEIVP
jgi:pantoate--beta-alanine ligase